LYPWPACYSPSPNTLTANYIPDATGAAAYKFASAVSGVYDVAPCITVTPASTTLTWAQSQSQPLSVAIVAASYTGEPVPTGSVTLSDGTYTSAPATLTGGSATIAIPAATLTTGFNILTANYAGDSNYAPYTGRGLVTVGGVTVTVFLSSSTITTTQPLTATITVSSVGGGPMPTGMVTLVGGGYLSATTPLSGGTATIVIPAGALAVGVDRLGADYGDGNYAGSNGSASVTVTGPGVPAFAIGGTTVVLTPGATTGNTSTITVTPAGGFIGSVALTASITSSPYDAQYPPTLSFGSSSPVSITGSSAGTATLTISTTAAVSSALAESSQSTAPWYLAANLALAFAACFGRPAWRRRCPRLLGMIALSVLLAGGLSACGNKVGSAGTTGPGTTPGNYTVTITGTSGTTTETGSIALTVQ